MSLSSAVRTLLKTAVPSSPLYRHISSVTVRLWTCGNSRQVLRLPTRTSLILCRNQSDTSTQSTTDGEQQLIDKLQKTFPKATEIRVLDISGGCGNMFEVHVLSEEFRGVRTVMQHRMVNEALKDEIKNMHGLRISTSTPDV